MERILISLFISFSFATAATAQPCITTFPYRETFEASDGNWIAAGNLSDWAWGAPTKPVISAAGEGTKCWITGGLTASFYNNGERSFLQSPCFNFSARIHPRISFKIFWETEKIYDGADLQYSTDGGITWLNVGDANSNSNCTAVNWYNSSSVRFISNKPGWAGNIQNGSCTNGGGSGGWLTASHDLTMLAGQPNVIFRFEFGAGTQCNDFDGFAIDDVQIFEAPPNTADFSYSCEPAQTVAFTSLSSCATATLWSFGDPSSGENVTGIANPVHQFSSPGTYTVILNATFASGAAPPVSKQITVLDVAVNLTTPISCNGAQNAVLTAQASGSSTGYTYSWNTSPVQATPVINNVGAGTYIITANAGPACPASDTVIVTEPPALQINAVITPQKCLTNSGAIISNVSGGIPGYNYLWSTGATTADIAGLAAGTYSLQVIDSHACTVFATGLQVIHSDGGLTVNLGPDKNICPGDKLILKAGNFSTYLWQDGRTSPTYDVTVTGDYSVMVTDANGCRASDAVRVNVECTQIYFPSSFTPNGDSKNEMFGPAGNNFTGIYNYRLDVYNRYGENVFFTVDPYKKWDGKIKGKISGNETFVWVAGYDFKGLRQINKGTVTLIK